MPLRVSCPLRLKAGARLLRLPFKGSKSLDLTESFQTLSLKVWLKIRPEHQTLLTCGDATSGELFILGLESVCSWYCAQILKNLICCCLLS